MWTGAGCAGARSARTGTRRRSTGCGRSAAAAPASRRDRAPPPGSPRSPAGCCAGVHGRRRWRRATIAGPISPAGEVADAEQVEAEPEDPGDVERPQQAADAKPASGAWGGAWTAGAGRGAGRSAAADGIWGRRQAWCSYFSRLVPRVVRPATGATAPPTRTPPTQDRSQRGQHQQRGRSRQAVTPIATSRPAFCSPGTRDPPRLPKPTPVVKGDQGHGEPGVGPPTPRALPAGRRRRGRRGPRGRSRCRTAPAGSRCASRSSGRPASPQRPKVQRQPRTSGRAASSESPIRPASETSTTAVTSTAASRSSAAGRARARPRSSAPTRGAEAKRGAGCRRVERPQQRGRRPGRPAAERAPARGPRPPPPSGHPPGVQPHQLGRSSAATRPAAAGRRSPRRRARSTARAGANGSLRKPAARSSRSRVGGGRSRAAERASSRRRRSRRRSPGRSSPTAR